MISTQLYIVLFSYAVILAGAFVMARGAALSAHILPARLRLHPAYMAGLALVCAAPLVVGIQAAGAGSPELALAAPVGASLWFLTFGVGATLCVRLASLTTPPFQGLSLLAAGGAALLSYVTADGALERMEAIPIGVAALLCLRFSLKQVVWPSPMSEALRLCYDPKLKPCAWCGITYLLIGAGMLFTGADILLNTSSTAAHLLDISETRAGALLAGGGMALPALGFFSSFTRSHNAESLFGLTLGLAVFTGLAATAAACLVAALPVYPDFLSPLRLQWLGVAALLALLAWRGVRPSKGLGVLFIALGAFCAISLLKLIP